MKLNLPLNTLTVSDFQTHPGADYIKENLAYVDVHKRQLPLQPGYYHSHTSVMALVTHLPVLFWDGNCWKDKEEGHIQAIQKRYWHDKENNTIKRT